MSERLLRFWSDPSQPGAGREFTLGQLMRIGWQQFSRNFWRAILFAVGVWVIIGLIWLGVSMLILGTVLVAHGIGVLTHSPALEAATVGLMIPAGLALYYLIVIGTSLPLLIGYQWACIRSFDRPHMAFEDIIWAWQKPLFGPLYRYSLLLGAVAGGAVLAVHVAVAPLMPATLFGGGPAWLVAGGGLPLALFEFGVSGGFGLIAVGSLLAGPMICAARTPRIWAALREHWRVLRLQPRRVIIVAMIPLAAKLLLRMPVLLAGVADSLSVELPIGWIYLASWVAGGLFNLYYCFFVAAYFRAIVGRLDDTAVELSRLQ